jgi:Mor family transcriptional regulator
VDARAERLARNEMLFRDLNEQVELVADSLDKAGTLFEFFCECSDVDCTLRLPMLLVVYEDVRSDATLFVVAPAHDSPEIEVVLSRTDVYQIVRKRGEAAQFAAASDPRS